MQRVFLHFVYIVSFYFLQYFLSTRENRWLGWILILRYFLMGLDSAFNSAALPAVTGFLLGGGIDCAIHVLIYRVGRNRVRQRRANRVDKMNIQDLG